MGLISEALLKQLLKSGMPVLVIPQSMLEEEDDDDLSTVPFSSRVRISPS